MVIYTHLMPERFAGYNLGPVTLIRPSHRDDAGLHAHEAVHRRQFFRNPFMGLFYLLSASARQAYEVEAYRAQLALQPGSVDVLAAFLSTHYGLTLTHAEALALLTKKEID